MTDELLIEIAINELHVRSIGITQQFLEVHEIAYADDRPKVLHVETDTTDGTTVIYFAVKDEKFYFAVYLDTIPDISVIHTGTVPYHLVSFMASSATLTLAQLAELTQLKMTSGWNMGEKRPFGKSFYKDSSIHFEPNPEPGDFDFKLLKLLSFLEQDVQGIKQLVAQANGYIQVASIFHNGNTMLGGHHLDKHIINRMSRLNLAIDFDLYARGNFFKD